MSVRYIIGGSGCGKTFLCLKEISEKINHRCNHSLILVVPEQSTLQYEKALCSLSASVAVTAAQVLSFGRLSYHLFSEVGMSKRKLLTDTGKHMLLRKIVNEAGNELLFFGKAAQRDGFIELLSSIISELYRYDIAEENLEQCIAAMNSENSGSDTSLSLKLRDIKLILQRFKGYIKENYLSTDETLSILSEKISESGMLKGAEIWIDGFTGFTPAELKVIFKLLKKADSVTVTFPINASRGFSLDRLSHIIPIDPFYEPKHTLKKIHGFSVENNVEREEMTVLQTPVRLENSPQLKFLYYNYFSSAATPYENNDLASIYLLEFENRYEEIEGVAHKLISLVRDEGYRFRDIGILSGSLLEYEKTISNIFAEYDIPFFMDVKKDILSNPLTELIRAAVAVLAQSFSYESVFRFLKTGLTGIPRGRVDLLENYALAHGIKGYKWHMESFAQVGTGDSALSQWELEEINLAKNQLMEALHPFINGLTNKSKASIQEYSLRIFSMLDNLKVWDKLSEFIQAKEMEGDGLLVREYSQIYGKICAVFDKMVEIIGEEQVNPKDFAKILDSGLAATDLGLLPPAADQVVIGDLSRSMLPEIKVLFLVGASDKIFQGSMEGILNDDERIVLAAQGMELAPTPKQAMHKEPFILFSTLTKPSERLFLTCATGSLEGKAIRPHPIFKKLGNMFSGSLSQDMDVEANISFYNKISTPKATLKEIPSILRKSPDKVSKEESGLYKWYGNNPDYSGEIKKMSKIMADEEKNSRFLNGSSVKRLYGKDIVIGVSRLEKYVNCPFSYFMKYNLKATERKIFNVAPIDIGNLFHGILEEFTKVLQRDGISWREVTKKSIDQYVEECADTVVPSIGSQVYMSTSRLRHLVHRVKRVSKKSIWALSEHIKRGDFEFFGAELEFKPETGINSIEIWINNESRFLLTGRIDRIDVLDLKGNTYIKIIDYKSGNVRFDINDVFFGVQLQLMLYLDALIKNGKELLGEDKVKGELLPGGVFYFNINDPIISDVVPSADQLDEVILKAFKMSGLVLESEEVIKAMDNAISGYSSIIPVQLTSKGVSARSSTAPLGYFNEVRQAVNDKIKEIGKQMLTGDISAEPIKNKRHNSCRYCAFGSICGFKSFK